MREKHFASIHLTLGGNNSFCGNQYLSMSILLQTMKLEQEEMKLEHETRQQEMALQQEEREKEREGEAQKDIDALAQFQGLQQAHEIECDKLNLRVLTLEEENSKLQEIRKACNMFETQSHTFKVQISEMADEKSKVETEHEKERNDHQEVKGKLEKRVKELDEANIALVHNLQKAHEQEKDEMKEDLKKLRTKVKQLEEDNDMMVTNLKEKGEVEDDWKRLQDKISRLEQENDVLLQDLQKSPTREELEDEIEVSRL